MAGCKRLLQLAAKSKSSTSSFSNLPRSFVTTPSPPTTSLFERFDTRQISQLVKSNGNRVFLVDTLHLVRGLEAQGVPSKQAEAITSVITEVLNDSLENVAHSLVSKPEMQKTQMLQESNLLKFKSELQSSQEHHYSMLQCESKKLRTDLEKMLSELSYEIDKFIASQRLYLCLERGRIRDELDLEIHAFSFRTEVRALRAQMKAAKYDVIKYCIGALISLYVQLEAANFC